MVTTFRQKIILLTALSVLLSSIAIVVTVYSKSATVMKEKAISLVAADTRLIALKFQSAYDHIRNDAYIAANATAVIELAKIIKEANATQQDVKLWTERLEDNFISIMKKKRYYTQMRFIGFHDNGREIVRVNQNDRGFERVKNDDLQYKGKEFYFAEADSLAFGEDYFSKITYNKDYGEVEPEKTPTLRSIVPVFDAQGNKFGFVVINVDYRRLLIAQYRDIKPEKNTYIINEYGDYMEYSPKKGLLDLVLGGADQNFSLQFLRTDEAELRDEYYVETTEDLIYSVKLNIAPDMDDNYLRAVLIIPRDEVFYQTNQVLYSIYVLSVLMVICTVIFSMIVSHFLTRSLCEMSKTLTRAIEQRDYKMDNLPVHQNDEVGDIARACDALSEEIHKRGLK
ncbi:MAG: hypothetical protein VX196_06570 [Pseudomonadota bacterium]|nr:hypothetical protein [Pseudomonadota bacterium]